MLSHWAQFIHFVNNFYYGYATKTGKSCHFSQIKWPNICPGLREDISLLRDVTTSKDSAIITVVTLVLDKDFNKIRFDKDFKRPPRCWEIQIQSRLSNFIKFIRTKVNNSQIIKTRFR